tara:strand:+ start:2209 stop:2382 length:174 start_codon:yes stop_codon:yes gene_type:complete
MEPNWVFPASMSPTDFGRQMQIILFANPSMTFAYRRTDENIEVFAIESFVQISEDGE